MKSLCTSSDVWTDRVFGGVAGLYDLTLCPRCYTRKSDVAARVATITTLCFLLYSQHKYTPRPLPHTEKKTNIVVLLHGSGGSPCRTGNCYTFKPKLCRCGACGADR